jgi:hypothetical protein
MKRALTVMLLITVTTTLVFARSDFIKTGETAPDFTLKDQFDKEFALKNFTGKIVVVFYTGREKSAHAANFGKMLDDKYNNLKDSNGGHIKKIEIVPVGALKGVPRLLRNTVKNFIKNKQTDGKPDPTPLLLDWKGFIADKYGYNKSEVNVYIIGRDEKIVFAGIVVSKDDEVKVIETVNKLTDFAKE